MEPVAALKRVIVNADDFGLTSGATRAIAELLESGAVTSASLVTNGAAFESAIRFLQANSRSRWSVGLHVNLSQFTPVGDARGLGAILDRQGRYRGRAALIRASLGGRLMQVDLEEEVNAQFAACAENGLMPDHLDSHQHVHALPQVHRAMRAVAQKHDLPIRVLRPWHRRRSPVAGFRNAVLSSLDRWNTRGMADSRTAGMRLISVFSADAKPSVTTYARVIEACPAATMELMVHPAVVDREHEAEVRISDVCRMDYTTLSSPQWREFMETSPFEWTTFRRLGNGKYVQANENRRNA